MPFWLKMIWTDAKETTLLSLEGTDAKETTLEYKKRWFWWKIRPKIGKVQIRKFSVFTFSKYYNCRLHRYWLKILKWAMFSLFESGRCMSNWRLMLETKCVDDNIQKLSPTSSHQQDCRHINLSKIHYENKCFECSFLSMLRKVFRDNLL